MIILITLLVLVYYVQCNECSILNQYDTVSGQIVDKRSRTQADNNVVLLVIRIKIYAIYIYIMDSEQLKNTPSEKTKSYLTKKLSEIEIKLKKMKKKKIIIQTIGSILIIGSMSSSVLIASLVFPPLVVTSLSIASAIMSGISIKMNFSEKSKKISKLLTKLNQLQIKLDYVVSCNGDLTEAEYQSILRDFDY